MVLASLINRAANAVISIGGARSLLAVNDPAENRLRATYPRIIILRYR